jgi:hypothetical protein
MCLRRAPEKYITGAMVPVGAALDRAAIWRNRQALEGLSIADTKQEERVSYYNATHFKSTKLMC